MKKRFLTLCFLTSSLFLSDVWGMEASRLQEESARTTEQDATDIGSTAGAAFFENRNEREHEIPFPISSSGPSNLFTYYAPNNTKTNYHVNYNLDATSKGPNRSIIAEFAISTAATGLAAFTQNYFGTVGGLAAQVSTAKTLECLYYLFSTKGFETENEKKFKKRIQNIDIEMEDTIKYLSVVIPAQSQEIAQKHALLKIEGSLGMPDDQILITEEYQQLSNQLSEASSELISLPNTKANAYNDLTTQKEQLAAEIKKLSPNSAEFKKNHPNLCQQIAKIDDELKTLDTQFTKRKLDLEEKAKQILSRQEHLKKEQEFFRNAIPKTVFTKQSQLEIEKKQLDQQALYLQQHLQQLQKEKFETLSLYLAELERKEKIVKKRQYIAGGTAIATSSLTTLAGIIAYRAANSLGTLFH